MKPHQRPKKIKRKVLIVFSLLLYLGMPAEANSPQDSSDICQRPEVLASLLPVKGLHTKGVYRVGDMDFEDAPVFVYLQEKYPGLRAGTDVKPGTPLKGVRYHEKLSKKIKAYTDCSALKQGARVVAYVRVEEAQPEQSEVVCMRRILS